MNQDIFCFDIPNQNLDISSTFNSEIFNDKNIELSNNQKNEFSQKINMFSLNNYYFGNYLNNIKNEDKTESNKEKGKDNKIKLNFDIYNNNNNIYNNYFCQINNNINNNFDYISTIKDNFNNNNISNCNYLNGIQSQFLPFNENIKKLPNEDYFLNTSLINDNNQLNFNENNGYLNFINTNNMINFIYDNNYNIDINQFFEQNNNSDSESDNDLNINKKKLDNLIYKEEKVKNGNNNYNDTNLNNNLRKGTFANNNVIINLGVKRKIKRKKEKKINQIIQYGHPKRINYKTMKQKLNIHKKLDLECRNDSILLIYSISKLKNILKKIISQQNIKDKIYFKRIQNIYRNSILSLQYKEYAQEITGFKLI